jgi:hypothetical protein
MFIINTSRTHRTLCANTGLYWEHGMDGFARHPSSISRDEVSGQQLGDYSRSWLVLMIINRYCLPALQSRITGIFWLSRHFGFVLNHLKAPHATLFILLAAQSPHCHSVRQHALRPQCGNKVSLSRAFSGHLIPLASSTYKKSLIFPERGRDINSLLIILIIFDIIDTPFVSTVCCNLFTVFTVETSASGRLPHVTGQELGTNGRRIVQLS